MNFFKRYPLTFNLLAMFLVGILLIVIGMWSLKLLTAHGAVREVPDVRTMSVAEAQEALKQYDLLTEVVDSVYNHSGSRGMVVEQVPPAGNRVKPGRTVYLTINAYEAQKITLPDLVGTSVRQAKATLQTLGFTDIREVRVPSDYRDLVLAVKSMGVPLRAGSTVPVSSTIVIEVGEGFDYSSYEALNDTIEALSESEWIEPEEGETETDEDE
ncbi:MAG: PASTA domain-containing protein [Muribaculaceae bacterium]|nr:PASTA domain-containing protein [Muribaculaceae bacterium]